MAISEQPPSLNDGAVARNPGVSWAFLFGVPIYPRRYAPGQLWVVHCVTFEWLCLVYLVNNYLIYFVIFVYFFAVFLLLFVMLCYHYKRFSQVR